MSLSNKFKKKQFPIMVSLPKNDVQLALAAFDAGADGVKVHLNAHHRASGTTFGSFKDERKFLIELAKIPCDRAIMVGQEQVPTASEMAELAKMGFEYFNCYLKHAQKHLLESKVKSMLALSHGYTDADIAELSAKQVAAVEASIVDPSDYGKPLDEYDLKHYMRIVQLAMVPVVVPSQKKILTSDLGKLKETGIAGLLIGVIVTGADEESIFRTTREFVDARDELWAR